MDYRDLGYFEVIAELGHLGLAAEKLCRTQSALSKCVRRLEEELDAKLFERSGRRITLTPIGALLLERAKIMRRGMNESKRQIADFSNGITGHVRLGVSSTMAELVLPAVTAQFLADAPRVTLELKLGMNDMLRDLLNAGHIDIMLGPLEGKDATTESHPIVEDEVVVVAAPNHPIFAGPLDLNQLANYHWVLPSRQASTRRWLDQLLMEAGLSPASVQVETNSILLLPPLIAENGLLSLLSKRNLGPGRPGHPLQEVPITGARMRRTFGVLYRNESILSPAALCLLRILRRADHISGTA